MAPRTAGCRDGLSEAAPIPNASIPKCTYPKWTCAPSGPAHQVDLRTKWTCAPSRPAQVVPVPSLNARPRDIYRATLELVVLADIAHAPHARRRRVLDPEERLDAPDDPANRCSNNRPDRARDTIALFRAMLEAAWETTLSLGRDRSCHGSDDDACTEDFGYHETTPLIFSDSLSRQPTLAFQ